MEFNERILQIIDTYEAGSKSRFAAKTGMHNQVYTILRPGYKYGRITVDRIVTAYPDISVEWLTSGTGEMTVDKAVEKTDKPVIVELPDNLTAPQILSYLMTYAGTDSLAKLSVKLNVKLKELNQVYDGQKTIGPRLAQNIRKVFREFPYQWLTKGESSYNPESNSVKRNKEKPQIQVKQGEDNPQPQVQPQIQYSMPNNIIPPIENKSYVQELEMKIQTISKINESLMSDYQKLIEINHRLNTTIIELTEKVIVFNAKFR